MHDLTSRTDTALIAAPWLLPPVTATYRRPESRLARRARMFRASRFARHLVAAADFVHDTTMALLWGLAAGLGAAALIVGLPDIFASALRLIGAGQ